MEVEVKLALTAPVAPEQVEALDWRPYTLGRRDDVAQRDTFFDTPALALSQTRHAVRLREAGPKTVVTLKGPGTVAAGVHEREELELPTSDHAPADWPAEVRSRLQELIGTLALEPLLTVQNQRRTWPLLRNGAVIGEVALDTGTISAGARSEPMHELEIELKGGTRADLETLSALAQRALPAQPEDRSKFARGLALLGPRPGAS